MTGLPKPRRILLAIAGLIAPLLLNSCGSSSFFGRDTRNKMIVSVNDQKMLLVHDGKPVKTYKISTSKFGVGDTPNSHRTPLGRLQVAKKIGCDAPAGAVFKSRRPTGEVLKPNSPGRDPIVSRILWLTGTEDRNRNTYRRTIYIHGTPEEKRLGAPASYGCIRMGSKDVIDLYDRIGHGADVFVIRGSIQSKSANQASASTTKPGGKLGS
jgi:L,D-transpeptidase catalytic domain